MEGKNKFNTYVVSFNYPSSYSSVFLRLRSLMYDMNFSSIVADEYGIPRQLNENSFAITTSLAASEIEDLIRLKCLDLPDIDWICPYISRHLLSLNPLLACCRRYSRGER